MKHRYGLGGFLGHYLFAVDPSAPTITQVKLDFKVFECVEPALRHLQSIDARFSLASLLFPSLCWNVQPATKKASLNPDLDLTCRVGGNLVSRFTIRMVRFTN